MGSHRTAFTFVCLFVACVTDKLVAQAFLLAVGPLEARRVCRPGAVKLPFARQGTRRKQQRRGGSRGHAAQCAAVESGSKERESINACLSRPLLRTSPTGGASALPTSHRPCVTCRRQDAAPNPRRVQPGAGGDAVLRHGMLSYHAGHGERRTASAAVHPPASLPCAAPVGWRALPRLLWLVTG